MGNHIVGIMEDEIQLRVGKDDTRNTAEEEHQEERNDVSGCNGGYHTTADGKKGWEDISMDPIRPYSIRMEYH